MNTFLTNYLTYNSANEVPDIFNIWGGVYLLNATAQRRIYTSLSRTADNYGIITPNLYIGFIGAPASGKSFAADIAKKMFEAANPFLGLGASRETLEAIATRLTKDEETAYVFINENKESLTTHSLSFFINEIKNWLGVNPIGMIDFMTDIYDRRYYDARTIKHGLQGIDYPCINILACETAKWIQDKFKANILSGGFARRFVCVYHPQNREHKADQSLHPKHKEAERACIAHLKRIQSIVGRLNWDNTAWDFYTTWYERAQPNHPNELMQQFLGSENIQIIKLAIAMALNQPEPELVLLRSHLEEAIEILNTIKPNMALLFNAIGRNELIGPMQRMMSLISAHGRIADKQLLTEMTNDLSHAEYIALKMQLKHTEQIITQRCLFEPDKIEREWVMTPEYAIKLKQK